MKVRQAYQFKLKTNRTIESLFYQYSGSCRFVWNKALSLIKDRLLIRQIDKTVNQNVLTHYKKPVWLPNYYKLAGMLSLWKTSKECAFLNDVPSQTLQQTLKDLGKAIKAAFTKDNGIRFPKFKKKYDNNNSFRYPQGFRIKGNRVFLPKVGWVKFFKSQEIYGKPKNITVKQYADGWYISIVTEQNINIQNIYNNDSDPVGIDVGVNKIVTLSNGYYFKPLDIVRLEKKLTKNQRVLSRKQHPQYKGDKTKCSKNFYKQKRKVQRIWKEITDKRNDYLQKLSTAIVKNHAIVVAEKLKIKNMTKSAKGTRDNPGRNIKQNSGLNKTVLRQGWGIFYRLLDYKLKRKGGILIKVNPKNTSITCPICQHKSKANRLSQSSFVCAKCGYANNADLAASWNILNKGLVQIGKDNPYKTLPQGMRKVTPVEYASHTQDLLCIAKGKNQEPAGKRNRKDKLLRLSKTA